MKNASESALEMVENAKNQLSELKHPSYGTIDNLLAEIKRDVKHGWYVRMGQINALNWFSEHATPEEEDEGEVEGG